MQFKNSENRYGIIAIFLHWLIALVVIAMIILGLYMVRQPASLQKLKLFGWHKEYGMLVLFLFVLRLSWRFINVAPILPAHISALQKLAAHGMHYLLYGMMIAMPLTGWMTSSAAGLSVSFFGLFVLPDLVNPDDNLRMLLGEVHEWLGYILIALICAHAGAALQHHFYHKDDILRRMLP
ncbi:MAG TPA: cytochrome b [Gammaproteobacteria bacterium]|jgi:cytochrome b561|nr:cytochrome b [Gammaproteobacteria bacterium]